MGMGAHIIDSAQRLVKLSGIRRAYFVFGEFDLVLEVHFRNTAELRKLVHEHLSVDRA